MKIDKEQTFIAKMPEEPRKPRHYELLEMQDDLSLFPDTARLLIEKYLEGEPLSSKEHSLFDRAQNLWWQEKYGFPYGKKVPRDELLRRKYASPKELTEQQKFQIELFGAFRDNNAEEIVRLRKIYEEQHPDQLEGIAVLFGLIPFFEAQQNLDKRKTRGWDEEALQTVQDLTEFQFLLSDFVRHNGRDKTFLSIFWEALEKIAKENNFLKEMHHLRRSILSSVALVKAFEAIGKHPVLGHPQEDAFKAIDIWADAGSVVQVKGAPLHDTPLAVVEIDSVSFPAIAIEENGEGKLFNSHLSHQLQKFHAKIKEYGAAVGKKLRGYFVVVPYEKFDFVTGEPDAEVVEKIRDALRTG